MEPLFSKEYIEKVTAFLKEHPEIPVIYSERYLEEGWEAWKMAKKPKTPNFVFAEIPLSDDRMLVFLNVAKTDEILDRYYDEFRKIAGRDFVPMEVIGQLRQGRTDFWEKLLLDHKAKGILFGYGYQNAARFSENEKTLAASPSENNDPRQPADCYLNGKPFRIPIFAKIDLSESENLIARYKQERERIKGIYEGKDFLKTTEKELSRPAGGFGGRLRRSFFRAGLHRPERQD